MNLSHIALPGAPAHHVAPPRTFAATLSFAAGAMLVSYLPFSAVNGVLGVVGASTGASTHDLQWVTDAFTLALTGAVLAGGSLAERLGRRRMTLRGLALTMTASFMGWVAGSLSGSSALYLLWTGQAVAGIGAGLVMSATLSLIGATATSATVRTRAIALWAAANVLGLGLGPFLSGGATSAVHGPDAWRWLFPPVLIVAAFVATFGLARSSEVLTPTTARLDLAGLTLGVLTAIAVVYGTISGGSGGWAAGRTLTSLALAGVLLLGFLVVESKTQNPVLDPALFRNRRFSAAGLAAAAVLFTIIGVVFLFSLQLAGRGVSSMDIAERIGFLFAGNALASIASGYLQNRYGSTAVLLGGLSTAIAGLLTLLGADSAIGLLELGWRLAVVGAGCGVVVASSTSLAVGSAPHELTAMAGTANNVIRQLGGALGTAVIGGVLAGRLAAGDDHVAAFHTCIEVLSAVLIVATALCCALLLAPTFWPSRTKAATHAQSK
jgi:MFS family permease